MGFTRKHPDRCLESAVAQNTGIKLNRETAVLSNVKIVGLTSVKNRRYTRKALNEALPLYEGVRVNLNHGKSADGDPMGHPSVDVRDRFGRIRNARLEADGAYGDLHYNPKHTFAAQFEWFAENDPSAIALSHDAILKGPYPETAEAIRIIESIPKVFSVDVVADPGSTRGLHESADMDLDAEGMDDSLYGEEDEDPAKEHLANAICEIVKDDSLDMAEKLKKIKALLGVMHSDDDSPPNEKKSMSDKKSESAVADPRDARIAELESQLEVYRVRESIAKDTTDAEEKCKTSGLDTRLITKPFVKSMVSRGRESWEEMIADRKAVLEERSDAVTSASRKPAVPGTADDFAKEVLSGVSK